MLNNPAELWQHAFWEARGEGVVVRVWARPGAKQEAVLGVKADAHNQLWLQISVKAAPEDGKANTALIAYLSELLDIKRSAITLLQGEKSRQKLFLLAITPEVLTLNRRS